MVYNLFRVLFKELLFMKKIAVVVDTNSGITQEEAKELGIYLVPMPFIIGEDVLYEGVDLSQEEF